MRGTGYDSFFQGSSPTAQYVDMRNHDNAVLDGYAEKGDEADGRGDVEGHAPNVQREHSAKDCQRQHGDEQSRLPEIAESTVKEQEHECQHQRNDDREARIGAALILKLPVPANAVGGAVVADGLPYLFVCLLQERG
ncbi:hypothetical protein Barb4_02465 [Bacteroidales bacterium Barb4]|nr:hypothetical protein Barb4_02465 [Bacteroidales bacterium Barb4]